MSPAGNRPQVPGQPPEKAAEGWAEHAEALADWVMSRVVVRRDAFGVYTPDGDQYTEHAPLSRDHLVRHYRGEPGAVIGLHAISTDNLCKAVAWDIDAHDEKADPEANWRYALEIADRCRKLGLRALIFDSNGKGGYHVRVFFRKPIPAEVAYWFCRQMVADHADYGFTSPPEHFPKQPGVTLANAFGNWIRGPGGRHHKRNHWTRIYDPAKGRWLEGTDAARLLVAVPGDKADQVLAAYEAEKKDLAERDGKTGSGTNGTEHKSNKRHRNVDLDKPDEATVRDALDHLPSDWEDTYGGQRVNPAWLGVGMALHSWDDRRGLALWEEFSRRSSTKYKQGACSEKWATFDAGGALKIGSIFYEAKRNGWVPPWETKDATASNGAAERNGQDDRGPGRGQASSEDDEREIEDRRPILDDAALHGIAGDVVRLVDPHTESHPVATLAQLLVAFGNLLGRGPHFTVSATRHYLNLFLALVGPTAAGRKGTSWDIVLWLLSYFDQVWADDRIQGGLVSGEGLISHVRDPSTKRVPKRAGKSGPIVGHEVNVVDEGIADKRLLVVETELSRMFKAMNRDQCTLSDVARQAWECRRVLQTMAKQSPEKATNAHVSIIGHTTKHDVLKHLSETDSANGFGNRFLWNAVWRTKMLPDGGNIEEENWTPIRTRLSKCIEFARTVEKMKRDHEAKAIWHGVYGDLSGGRPGLLGAILGRAEAQVMRVACLYALLDLSAVVRAEHLTAALAYWDYCEQSARLIFGGTLGDPDAEKLIAALKRAPGGMTRTEIRKQVFAGHLNAVKLAALLERLLNDGLVSRRTVPTAGKPAEWWMAGGTAAHKGGADAH